MTRGDLYLVRRQSGDDPRRQRVFVVVSRQKLIDTRFSTVICAPVYSRYDGLSTQVRIGVEEGLKHESSIHCDELLSLQKSLLTHFVGAVRGGVGKPELGARQRPRPAESGVDESELGRVF